MSELKTRRTNFRFPPSLIDAVDRARGLPDTPAGPNGKAPSRALWVERAIRAFLPKPLIERLADEPSEPVDSPDLAPTPGTPHPAPAPSPPVSEPPETVVGGEESWIATREAELAGRGMAPRMARRLAEKDVREGWRPE